MVLLLYVICKWTVAYASQWRRFLFAEIILDQHLQQFFVGVSAQNLILNCSDC